MTQYPSSINLDPLNNVLIAGETAFGVLGRGAAPIGDINGDGFADFAVAAPGDDSKGGNTGKVLVYLGQSGGPSFGLHYSDFDGNKGFQIVGATANGYAGGTVQKLGDVNGDHIDDFAISARGEGAVYVVFGTKSGFPASLDLSNLDGQGVKIFDQKSAGGVTEGFGTSIASADLNGDGVQDIVIGAENGINQSGNQTGAVYVVFGRTGLGSEINVTTLSGPSTGFEIVGETTNGAFGHSVSSAGDFNGDGTQDLIIGEPNSNKSFVLFGRANTAFDPVVQASDIGGANGILIQGDLNTYAGGSVTAGDVDGDGFSDVIIGGKRAYAGGTNGGKVWVIHGSPTPPSVNLLNLGSGDFQILASEGFGYFGTNVAAADVNGDGFTDIVASQHLYDVGANRDVGSVLVIFGGQTPIASSISLSQLDGDNGFRLVGLNAYDNTGSSLGLVDVDGDGFPDILTGAPGFDVDGGQTTLQSAGAALLWEQLGLPIGPVNRTGTPIANTILGSTSNDILSGLGGNDILNGRGGKDQLFGGAGADVLIGGPGADNIDGGTGINTADFSTSAAGVTVNLVTGLGARGDARGDVLVHIRNVTGSDHHDVITGNNLNNTLVGLGGPDLLIGGPGNDLLSGGAGGDILQGDAGNDAMTGDAGNDLFKGGSGHDSVDGGGGNDRVSYAASGAGVRVNLATGHGFGGQAAGDRLISIEAITGSAHNDVLNGANGIDVNFIGGAGDDALTGRNGNDALNGGIGDDLLVGGRGHDTFVFAGNFGHDIISDFASSNREKIDLSGVSAITGFHDLVNHHLFDDPGGSGFAVIEDGAGNAILVDKVTVDDFGAGKPITTADFMFA